MQNLPQATGPQQSLTMALGTAIGVAITLGIVTQLPLAQATIITSLAWIIHEG